MSALENVLGNGERRPLSLEELLARFDMKKRNGRGWDVQCPAHEDNKPSLSISEGDSGLLLHCHTGCQTEAILERLGLEWGDLFHEPPTLKVAANEPDRTFDYPNESGELLFQVVRFPDKQFRQRRPDGKGGWIWKLDGTQRVLYDLPLVASAVRSGYPVWVVEGEKDADALFEAGIVATTNPGGAGKWRSEYAETLRGAHVTVVADKDEPGRKHASEVAESLHGIAASVRLVEAKGGKDAADHLAAGHGIEDFVPMRDEDEDESAGHTWTPLDILDYANNPPTPPEISNLAYPGMRHVFSGEAEAGKSWLLLVLAADEIAEGRGVVWVDTDSMGPSAIVERLQQLGLSEEAIGRYFVYMRPSESLDKASRDHVLGVMAKRNSRLIIFDSFNATLTLQGLDPNSTPDIERFWRLSDAFKERGAAIVVLDHVVKNQEARGKYAYGSERKHSGAEVHIGLTIMEHIVRGKTGRSRLSVHKDRAGYHRDHPPGIFRVTSDPETGAITAALVPDETRGEDGGFRPTALMERVSRYLELFSNEGRPRKDIESNVSGKAEYLRQAIDVLVSEGYAEETEGAHGARLVHLVRAYREGGEAS